MAFCCRLEIDGRRCGRRMPDVPQRACGGCVVQNTSGAGGLVGRVTLGWGAVVGRVCCWWRSGCAVTATTALEAIRRCGQEASFGPDGWRRWCGIRVPSSHKGRLRRFLQATCGRRPRPTCARVQAQRMVRSRMRRVRVDRCRSMSQFVVCSTGVISGRSCSVNNLPGRTQPGPPCDGFCRSPHRCRIRRVCASARGFSDNAAPCRD